MARLARNIFVTDEEFHAQLRQSLGLSKLGLVSNMEPPRGIDNDQAELSRTTIGESYAASPLPDMNQEPQSLAAGNAPVDDKFLYTE